MLDGLYVHVSHERCRKTDAFGMVMCFELFDDMGEGVEVMGGEGVLAGENALHFVEVFVVFELAAAVHIKGL